MLRRYVTINSIASASIVASSEPSFFVPATAETTALFSKYLTLACNVVRPPANYSAIC